MNAIEVKRLQKYYGDVHALRDVSLTVEQGEFFGLLGPNGAGKSTLINIIAGLVTATSGNAAVNGADVVDEFRQTRQSLGVVPQEIVQDVFFSVKELLRIQSGLYGLGRDNWPWIDELLEILGLSEKASANMRALSGGMKRRVMIAQAMVHKPPILILDEPTAGVDVELRETMWSFVKDLHSRGHTVILTTHYLEEAQQLCDRIAIIDHGQVVAMDTKDSLIEKHTERLFWITLSGGHIALPESLTAKQSTTEQEYTRYQFSSEDFSIGKVVHHLHQAGLEIYDVHVEEPNLENVFRQLTSRN